MKNDVQKKHCWNILKHALLKQANTIVLWCSNVPQYSDWSESNSGPWTFVMIIFHWPIGFMFHVFKKNILVNLPSGNLR